MLSQLLNRVSHAAVSTHSRSQPDAAYDVLPRFTRLAAELTAAHRINASARTWWKEPPVFFFDSQRQSEYEAACSCVPKAEPFGQLADFISAELPGLYTSIELRRVARAMVVLRQAAVAMADVCPKARELAELLAVPDEETITVLHPETRAGYRVCVEGVADVGQFHVLLADAIGTSECVPQHIVVAYQDVKSSNAADVPIVAKALFQMYTPAALLPNGELPTGFSGCQHWLWPNHALASVPRVNDERVVLLGPPAFQATWEVARRFPAMPASLQIVETLSPFRVAERLSDLCGQTVPPSSQREEMQPAIAKAA